MIAAGQMAIVPPRDEPNEGVTLLPYVCESKLQCRFGFGVKRSGFGLCGLEFRAFRVFGSRVEGLGKIRAGG